MYWDISGQPIERPGRCCRQRKKIPIGPTDDTEEELDGREPDHEAANTIPTFDDEHAYALEISGNSMEPVYRDGTVVVVSPAAPIRRGDRVVVKTTDGEVMARELKRRTAKSIELRSLNSLRTVHILPVSKVAWTARIMWASQ
jgi:phage repressor protein C with HTH and peptisase S24 domain